MYEVEKYRADFPILSRQVYGKPLVYLDNAASTQAPMAVVDAIDKMYTQHRANVHRGVHCLSQEATDAQEDTRKAIAKYINAPSHQQIIFTSGTTCSLNMAASILCQTLKADDEVILTVMEHHSNIVPWQLAQARIGFKIKVVPITPIGELDLDAYRRLFTPKTRIVAFCHVSNVLGTINPAREIIDIAHAHGCITVVDGAQGIGHLAVDVQALDCDFYAFSAHKLYGPTGVGVLYGRRELLEALPPYQGGGEMIAHVSFEGSTWADLPFKFEAGTPNYIGIAGFHAALRYVERIGIEAIAQWEDELMRYATEGMMEIPGMRIFGHAPHKSAVISFQLGHAHHYDTGMLLDKLGIAIRTGHHCAQPLMHALGVEGTARASMALYTTRQDVDAFLAALRRIAPLIAQG